MKLIPKHQDLQILVSNQRNTSTFYSFEVVGRGSETQLQVGEKI